jgi:hypothetical protein
MHNLKKKKSKVFIVYYVSGSCSQSLKFVAIKSSIILCVGFIKKYQKWNLVVFDRENGKSSLYLNNLLVYIEDMDLDYNGLAPESVSAKSNHLFFICDEGEKH